MQYTCLIYAAVVPRLLAMVLEQIPGNILLLVGVSWLLGIASSSLALLVGCGVASAQKAGLGGARRGGGKVLRLAEVGRALSLLNVSEYVYMYVCMYVM